MMGPYYLIGERLPHSFSKAIHEAFGRYEYELKELSPAELGPFLEARNFRGLNVTIPYKEAVMPWLDRIDPAAAAIGAVNTVVNRDGQLWGYNTDFGGMEAGLRQAGIEIAGKTVLILGTGGTSKTALAVCRHLGAREALRVSRGSREGALSYQEAAARYGTPRIRPGVPTEAPSATAGLRYPQGEGSGSVENAGPVIINATPAGMYPDLEPMALDPGQFPGLEGVFDCVYNPLRTRLVLEARKQGLPAAGGLYMLVKQAALACGLFTDRPLEEEETRRVYEALGRERESLVLIGMPGAGKTTVGRLLAQNTGKEFVDCDEVIVRRAGMPISEIFARFGEPRFRDLESEVIRDLSRTGGRVIATGGGAVLRPENVTRLRQNGRLFLLDRPPESLIPTEDRPLGNSAEKIAALYAVRSPLYRDAADVIISNPATPASAAAEILAAP